MTSEMAKTPLASRVLFRLGQFSFIVGFICFVIGIATSHWVDRPIVNMTAKGITGDVTLHYGIFTACLQKSDAGDSGNCAGVGTTLNYVDEKAATFVQALMVISCILFTVGFILEIIQILPIDKYRNFIAQNRMVELFSSVAAVIALVGIVIYAGEIKNKAERVDGQDEESVGWSFIVTVIGLVLGMLGVMTVTMFRDLPIQISGEKGGSWLRL